MIQKKNDIGQQPYTLVKNRQLPPMIARLMLGRKDGYVRIANTRWQELNMQKNCKMVLKWSVKHLDLQQNSQPRILLHISEIKFSNLTILNLSSNLIESIEALTSLNFRNLQDINLANNKIICLQSLRRLHTFRLRSLKICNNPFQQIGCLSEMPLMNLQILVLENEVKKTDLVINLWKLLKFQSLYLKNVRNWDYSFKKMGENGQWIIRDRFIELKPGRNM